MAVVVFEFLLTNIVQKKLNSFAKRTDISVQVIL